MKTRPMKTHLKNTSRLGLPLPIASRLLPLLLTLLLTNTGFAQDKDKDAKLREDLERKVGDKVEMRFDQPYAGTTNRFQMLDLYLPKK